MSVKVQRSAYGPWNVHLEAMRTIILQRAGFRNVARECYLPNNSLQPNYALHTFMLLVAHFSYLFILATLN
jgi:hypothetical protein